MVSKNVIVGAAKSAVTSAAKKTAGVPVEAANEAFTTLVAAWKDCSIVAEQEQTKRESIRAFRDINVKAIEETSVILKEYLKSSFAEREAVIQGMFDRLDKGIESGDLNVIAATIGAIVDVAKNSPLDAARGFIASYHDPDVKHIEI